MKKVTLLSPSLKNSLFFLTILFCSFGTHSQALDMPKDKVINDSLVSNLSCTPEIEINDILSHIKPDFTSAVAHIPQPNWSFRYGFYDLANCWSLARAQRILYYLARFSSLAATQEPIAQVLDLFRAYESDKNQDGQWSHFHKKNYSIFFSASAGPDVGLPFWSLLNSGIRQNLSNGESLARNFKTDIEFYQSARFHDLLRNGRFIKEPNPLDTAHNLDLRDYLLNNLAENRLTLINIRDHLTLQHVVLVKSFYQDSNGNYIFKVYDSNFPQIDNKFYFDKAQKVFFAPEILRAFPHSKLKDKPIPIYIIEEDDRALIERALEKYYRKLCR